MKKRMSITVAIVVSAFVAINVHLLYSKKSTVQQTVYVHQYERMTEGHFEETIPKEGLVSPAAIYTVYVGNEETIDTWLVKEGDQVQVGDEIATLQSDRAESQLAAWEAEEQGLLEQQSAIESTLYDLEADRASASGNTSNVNTTETPGTTDIELTVDVQVDVSQDGAYAQAIAQAERELAEVERKLTVIQAQLAQNPMRPALISPVNGTVSTVNKHGYTLAADVFSEEKLITTYAELPEWQKIEAGDPVRIQENSLDTVIEGTVHAVSQVPATDSRWRDAYDELAPDTKRKNPMELYEITIMPLEQLTTLPFGANVNATLIVNEVDAVSVKVDWLEAYTKQQATAWQLDENGQGRKIDVSSPFQTNNRAVITDGLATGDIVIYKHNISTYADPFNVIMPLPLDLPPKSQWRTFGWKNYIKHGFLH